MQYQKYRIHLVGGEIIRCAEECESQEKDNLVERFRKAELDDLITIGDEYTGYAHIPKRNILYISEGTADRV